MVIELFNLFLGKTKKFLRRFFACMVAVLVVMTVFTACSSSGNSNEKLQGSKLNHNILMVKLGSPELIPDITYEDAYDNFFVNPEWRGFEADDGSDVVEFSGECTYGGEDATVYIQFVVENSETFYMHYVSIDVGGEQIDADYQTYADLVYTPFSDYAENVLGEELDDDVKNEFLQLMSY